MDLPVLPFLVTTPGVYALPEGVQTVQLTVTGGRGGHGLSPVGGVGAPGGVGAQVTGLLNAGAQPVLAVGLGAAGVTASCSIGATTGSAGAGGGGSYVAAAGAGSGSTGSSSEYLLVAGGGGGGCYAVGAAGSFTANPGSPGWIPGDETPAAGRPGRLALLNNQPGGVGGAGNSGGGGAGTNVTNVYRHGATPFLGGTEVVPSASLTPGAAGGMGRGGAGHFAGAGGGGWGGGGGGSNFSGGGGGGSFLAADLVTNGGYAPAPAPGDGTVQADYLPPLRPVKPEAEGAEGAEGTVYLTQPPTARPGLAIRYAVQKIDAVWVLEVEFSPDGQPVNVKAAGYDNATQATAYAKWLKFTTPDTVLPVGLAGFDPAGLDIKSTLGTAGPLTTLSVTWAAAGLTGQKKLTYAHGARPPTLYLAHSVLSQYAITAEAGPLRTVSRGTLLPTTTRVAIADGFYPVAAVAGADHLIRNGLAIAPVPLLNPVTYRFPVDGLQRVRATLTGGSGPDAPGGCVTGYLRMPPPRVQLYLGAAGTAGLGGGGTAVADADTPLLIAPGGGSAPGIPASRAPAHPDFVRLCAYELAGTAQGGGGWTQGKAGAAGQAYAPPGPATFEYTAKGPAANGSITFTYLDPLEPLDPLDPREPGALRLQGAPVPAGSKTVYYSVDPPVAGILRVTAETDDGLCTQTTLRVDPVERLERVLIQGGPGEEPVCLAGCTVLQSGLPLRIRQPTTLTLPPIQGVFKRVYVRIGATVYPLDGPYAHGFDLHMAGETVTLRSQGGGPGITATVALGATVTFTFLEAVLPVLPAAASSLFYLAQPHTPNVSYTVRAVREGTRFEVLGQTPAGLETLTVGPLPPGIRTIVIRNPAGEVQAFPVGPPVCFQKGTRLLTPTGYRAVETLRIGDPVFTPARADPVPVENLVAFSDSGAKCPLYCLPANAVKPGQPSRALYMSGDHAFRDAARVWRHMKCSPLTVRVPTTAPIPYYHVILPAYWPLRAEGAFEGAAEGVEGGVEEGVEVESLFVDRAGHPALAWDCTATGCVPLLCTLVEF